MPSKTNEQALEAAIEKCLSINILVAMLAVYDMFVFFNKKLFVIKAGFEFKMLN